MKRLALALIVAGPFVAAAVGVWLTRGSSADRTQRLPHGAFRASSVLLVTIDTLRADHVGAYGSDGELTPAIDELAREGLVFGRVYAHVPLTLPSHASLMTAMYPFRSGVRDSGPLPPDVPTLASALHAAGYRTGAFVGASVLGARSGLDRGFDVYDDGGSESTGRNRIADQVLAPAHRWVVDRSAEASRSSRQSAIANQQSAISNRQSPWFAWVHLSDPHEPYSPPEPYRSRFPGEPYDGEVAYADAALGRFLGRLRAAGALDRALVVLTSDHGESLGEHGETTHGVFAYDATLRVPLLMWAPRRLRPGSFSKTVRLVDVAPTLLDLAGLAPWSGVDGRSIRPFVAGERPFEDAGSYFEVPRAGRDGGTGSPTRQPRRGVGAGSPTRQPRRGADTARVRGLVLGWTKLIERPAPEPPELYDLAADPGERDNIYPRQRGRARDLERRLDALARTAPRR